MEIKGTTAKRGGVITDNQTQPLLVPFTCDKCGKILAWALPEATVLCKHCGKWIANSNAKKVDKAFTA